MNAHKHPIPASLIVLLILFSFSPTRAQTIETQFISVSDGLASPFVRDVIQDRYGLIWVATSNGLQKYDGLKWESFKNIPGKPASLQSVDIWGLAEDEDHNLWVASGLGVSKYDRKKNVFINYDFTREFSLYEGAGRAFNIFIDSDKKIWATTEFVELVFYDPASDSWKYPKYEVPGIDEPSHMGLSLGVTEDKLGGLWFGSSLYGLMHRPKGQEAFKPEQVSFRGVEFFRENEEFITDLYADTLGMLWITTRNGVYKYNPENKSLAVLQEYDQRRLTADYLWNSIQTDPNGDVWISNNSRGILKFDGLSDSFQEMRFSEANRIFSGGWDITLTDFMIDKSGIFWFGNTTKGLIKYNPVNKPFTYFSHEPSNPNSISPNGVFGLLASKAQPGKVYVGTRGGGINVFDPENRTFSKVKYNAVNDMFGGSVRGIFEDDDGTLWLGTWGDGLIKLDRNFKEERRYTIAPDSESGLSNNQVRVIKRAKDGKLWLGTNNGLNILDPRTGKVQKIPSTYSRPYPEEVIELVNGFLESKQKIASIEEVGDFQDLSQSLEIKEAGNYLVVSVGEGDFRSMADFGWLENEGKDTISGLVDFRRSYYAGGAAKNRIFMEQVSLEAGKYSLRYKTDDSHSFGKWNEDPPDRIPLYGIALIKMADQKIEQTLTSFMDQKDKGLTTSGANIFTIEIGAQYNWLGTNNDGLNRIDPGTLIYTVFSHDPRDPNSISSNFITGLLEDEKGFLWITTNAGLNKMDIHTGQITRYTEEDGLPTNLTEDIIAGENGEMWISTQNGISQMVTNESLGKVTFINYNSDDGLGGDTFISLAGIKTSDGRFYFGGDHGLTAFGNIAANNIPPNLILSNLLVSNKSVFDMGDDSPLLTDLGSLDQITLKHDQNALSFEFAALHFSNPKKNQLAHKLEGFDEDWIYDNRNFASYTNLDPGEYTFSIRGSNADGVWNEAGKSLKIIILAPWWKTGWAYAAYALLFALAIFAVDRVQRRRIMLREREKVREKELKHAKEIEVAYENLKAAQHQLVQQEKLASLGQLTAGIAHEIKNPLNFVNNFSELSEELIVELKEALDKGDTEEAKELATDIKMNLHKIHEHGSRADRIVKSMLMHSRGGEGKKEPTDLNLLLKEYTNLAFHGMRAGKNPINVDLVFALDEQLKPIPLISEDFSRLVVNLANNAFDAIREKEKSWKVNNENFKLVKANGNESVLEEAKYQARLKVVTQKKGDAVVIIFEDNGIGIPTEIRNKILQPFFTTKKGTDGTGLGLSITNDIIKAHGGTLEIESETNQFSRFIITLI
ncbi:sensor histidine kinase [Pararhodonellum marinum]|uniref:sensor histidine kinase n=1 Tax=Pararhodonellum marinum TaxID=2755358 RepID=UPI00188E15ED|nr:sensor histidine kinase [Pararhodonellum marinum]